MSHRIKQLNVLTLALILSISSVSNSAKINSDAPVGGVFNRNIGGEPPTLHPISSTDLYASIVQGFIFDSLAARHPETGEWEPRTAERWEVSKDNKVYTFYLRKDATFSDGKPVTAEDVKFSLDAIRDPAYKAVHMQPYYEGIDRVEVIDPHTVKFYLKDTYFQNFISMVGMTIIPKHVYGDLEKSKKMSRTAIGSGPYKLDKFERGQRIVLKRRSDWYGHKANWKGSANFETINLRFVKEDAVAFEMIKRNEIDFMSLTPEYFVQKAQGAPWGQTVFKYQVENKAPKGYGFIGWNFRQPLFQDKNVRLALYHLLNREEMNQKFRFGMSNLATGPIYMQSEYASPNVKPVLFDPKKAAELLTKSGWKDSDKDGLLDKTIGGKNTPFKFSLIYSNKDVEKYWTMYKEDLRKAGIEMDLKYLEWNSFLKVLDEGTYDAAALGWSGSLEWDPKQIWHSSNAVPGGSNFIAYKNPEVDKLIDQARLEPDKNKRITMLRKIYELIAADVPYAFLFNDRYVLYANSAKVEKPADTFQFDVGLDYWWAKSQKMR
jgi:peptide/nickel transport system substrate-binding protein/microcin C transport system substrate-binding protein